MNEQVSEVPPLGLYVHLPWCLAKCPYCDFNSHALRGELPVSGYTEALLRDLRREAPRLAGRRLGTVFFGGGTPSLFPAEALARVLATASELVATEPDLEVTLEVNPGALELGDPVAFREAGVNRLSLGVQSFSDTHLQALGRIHGGREARAAAAAARDAGFSRLNLDLMFALPDQSLPEMEADLRDALALAPEHLSHYQLTLEPNTRFHADPPALPDDDTAADMQLRASDLLASAGYCRYEVSAWSRPGGECRHNLNYWRYGDYLGIGAGAHGKLSAPGARQIERFQRLRHPAAYMQADDPVEIRHAVGPSERVFEFMLNALRLTAGFDEDLFTARTGLATETVRARLAAACEAGLLARCGSAAWRPTARGLQFLNDLQLMFLPEAPAL